jgi:hypothetical protein
MALSAKITERISAQIRKYSSEINSALTKDINEADTCLIVRDMLCDVLGYDKTEITTEYAIKGTYADLAAEVDGSVRFLVEVKAVGISLRDLHVRQAVGYGATQGTEWVVLTNGVHWKLYKIHFGQPIEKILLCEIDILSSTPRSQKLAEAIECFGNLSREHFSKDSMADYFEQKQLTSKFAIAAILLSEPILTEIRRELRRLSPGLKIDVESLELLLSDEVIKRELIESEDGKLASALVKRLQKAFAKERDRKEADSISDQSVNQGVAQPQQETPV